MKVLLTGASSFTGMWFARNLALAGHTVVTPLQSSMADYAGTRLERVLLLRDAGVRIIESCAFGTDDFVSVLEEGWDVLCHHASCVRDYKSEDFDVLAAVASNTRGIRRVLQTAAIRSIVLTGSVFEADEGAGTKPLRAFSPYGLSKSLTWQIFSHWAQVFSIDLHKFVIPNPFGPWEEPRFCAYLLQQWARHETAVVQTPAYVRDNIHIDLLALAYTWFVEQVGCGAAPTRLNPSGYVESQGAFAKRFADQIGSRLAIDTPIAMNAQEDFPEPLVRINTDVLALPWDEYAAWQNLADYYRRIYFA